MKKYVRLLSILLACLLLVSCKAKKSEPQNVHTHKFGEWMTIQAPTCESEGKMVRYCDCGEKQEETILRKEHSYNENGVCSICGDVKVDVTSTSEILTETPVATDEFTIEPTVSTTSNATLTPIPKETAKPTAALSPKVTATTATPTKAPTAKPTPTPTKAPTATPTKAPTAKPMPTPTPMPKSGTREGNYIYFGSYPQSEVTDSSLKSSLTSAAGSTSNWTSYNYYISGSTSFMKYKDVTYNANKYRGVYFTRYRPYYTDFSSSSIHSSQDDNGYYTNTIYWFKYEPIKWKILEEMNGDAFLVTDMLIDAQDYNHTDDNNYANSSIRSWLNSTFYNTAFNSTEQGKIKPTKIDNSVASTGYSSNPNVCGDTNDKIFLLSYKEAMNSSYGFSSESSRVKNLTDYAKIQGAGSYSGCGCWWLCSPYYDSNNARYQPRRLRLLRPRQLHLYRGGGGFAFDT